MNPIVVQLANGNAFFIGVALTVVAFGLRLRLKARLPVMVLMVAWLVGISLVVLSATPISFWFYGGWFVLCIAARVSFNVRISLQSKIFVTGGFAAFSLVICLIELPFHLARTISVSRSQTVYVLGDSISAGIESKEKTWPNVLGDLSGLKTVNLARAGATVDTAMDQAVRIKSTNSLVLIEIGGNDLLGSTDSRTFYDQLDKLLGKLKDKNAQIAMFELPLLPFWNEFGRDQRLLARKYRVTLIPKKYLVSVFAGKGDTIDGLHLSQKGHNELAKEIYQILRIRP